MIKNKENKIIVETSPLYLNGGSYSITLVIQNTENQERLLRYDGVFAISIYSEYLSWSDNVAVGDWKLI